MTAESTPPPSGGADGPGAPGTAESGAEQPAPEEQGRDTAPPSDNRFFLWLRGLGITRRPGWVGGVCSGIAERLGIDPLIVRGIVVVVAVLGGPALLVYAAAWLLLPDEDGALPVEQLVAGRIERVHAGIGALILASMLPLAQGFWSLGGAYTGAEAWAPAAGRTIWTLVVIGLLVALTVWVARQAVRSPRPEAPEEAPGTTEARPDSVPLFPPPRPTNVRPDSPEDLAEWRARQEAWRTEREAFRAQQAASARETARQRAEEARARSRAAAAVREERRRVRRAGNPRLRASVTLVVLGAAAVIGALASLTASGTTAVVVGFAAAALVLAAAIVLAGLLRRRAALLVTASVLVLPTALVAAMLPPDRELLPIGSSYGVSNAVPGDYAMLTGDLQVTVGPDVGPDGAVIDVWQGAGTVSVTPLEGTAVRLTASSRNGDMWIVSGDAQEQEWAVPDSKQLVDGRWEWTQTFGDPAAEPVDVRVEQGAGSIIVHDTAGAPTDTGTPAPSAVLTDPATITTPQTTSEDAP
ncbi:PspC domain-containing protein [Rathayibacter sp. Leaf296]|uniref:PspC domain-containing protein n=1 Tax=Rathayibacter sp. Leaf296 TaxID=1736327 RepID=UPI000A8A9992|nr:PspC domain-containing protein [Rathayibacter sp. Leaf296]